MTRRSYATLDRQTGRLATEQVPDLGDAPSAPHPGGTEHVALGLVADTDPRLSDARSPTAHGHPDPANMATDQELATHAATAHGLSSHAIDGAFHSGVTVLPTAGQKNALAGTSGTPGTGNEYVTTQDARNSNARTPTAHAHPESEVTNLVADLTGKAATGHVHAGSPTVIKLSGEQVSAVTAFADIPGFTRAIAAGECVYFKAFLGYRANAITTGIRLGVNGPASPAKLFYRTTTTRTNALQSAAGATANEGTFNANTYDAPAADSGVAAVGVDYIATIEGVIFNGANAGTLAMRFASEVAIANGITLARGSHVMFWTI